MSDLSGVPGATFMALLAMALIVYAMILINRLVPAPARPTQTIRHEITFKGNPVEFAPSPPWLGERIVSGQIGKNGDTIRLNGSTIGLAQRYPAGARVAVHIVRA